MYHKTIRTHQLRILLSPQRQGIVALVPLPERRRINNNDCIFHQGLGAHQLIVASVVDHVNDTRLACSALRSPSEVASIQTQRSVLEVTTTGAHIMNAPRTQLCVGSRSTQLELALLAERLPLSSCGAPLVPVVPANTCVLMQVVCNGVSNKSK